MQRRTARAAPGVVPRPHRHWGGCADELLHYTSRYYPYTEAFLRNLTGRRGFEMAGYQAELLCDQQRCLMLAMLMSAPVPDVGCDVTDFVTAARAGDREKTLAARNRYATPLTCIAHSGEPVLQHHFESHVLPADLPPLDPLLAITERLGLPVAVAGHHVEICFEQLARHLDSTSPQVRDNLQQAIIWLHEAGYHLRNRPHLTHAQAR